MGKIISVGTRIIEASMKELKNVYIALKGKLKTKPQIWNIEATFDLVRGFDL